MEKLFKEERFKAFQKKRRELENVMDVSDDEEWKEQLKVKIIYYSYIYFCFFFKAFFYKSQVFCHVDHSGDRIFSICSNLFI